MQMKKIYSLIALFAMIIASVSINAQKYSPEEEATEIQPGVQYLLRNASSNRFATNGSAGTTAQAVDDNSLWVFEKTGKQVDGYDTWRIKNVGTGQYWQKESPKIMPEGTENGAEGCYREDGFDIHGYIGCNAAWGSADNAMEVTIEFASGADARTTGAGSGDGFVICNAEVFSWSTDGGATLANEGYYRLDTQTSGVENFCFAPWNVATKWTIWTAHENTPKDKLEILLEEVASAELDFSEDNIGTLPGLYAQETVTAWNELYTRAQNSVLQDLSDTEYEALFKELTEGFAKIKTAVNPVVEGYYYIVNGLSAFEEQQGYKKAIYGNSTTEPRWKNWDQADYAFLWKFEPKGEGWSVKNVLYDSYMHGAAETGNSKPLSMKTSTDRVITFTALGKGMWNIKDNFSSASYHANGHGGGAGAGSNLVTWNGGLESASAWQIVPVTDQEYIQGAINAHAQILIKEKLSGLIVEGGKLYDNLFVSTVDYDNPLVTEAADEHMINEEGNQFLYNRKEGNEGRYAALIDGVLGYKNEEGKYQMKDADGQWTYFHGCWSNTVDKLNGYSNYSKDFLQVDFKKGVQKFVYRSYCRADNPNAQPSQVGVYVTNDTTGYCTMTDKWTRIATIYPKKCVAEEPYVSPLFELDQEYRYVRFVIESTYNNVRYACYGEFNLYPAETDQTLSQYYYADGMKAAADKLKEVNERVSAAVEAGTATEAMIDELKAAIAAVKALYADPTELKSLIAEVPAYIEKATVGENFGNIKTQGSIDDLTNAYAAATEFSLEGAVQKSALDAVTNSLKSAKYAFLNDMVTPEAGKWYTINNMCTGEGKDAWINAAIYATGVAEGNKLSWSNEGLDGKATGLWRFVPVEDAEKPNTVYIQNMATGMYIGSEANDNKLSTATTLSTTPVPFVFTFVGGDSTAIVPASNTAKTGLHAAAANKAVVGWYYTDNTASLWTFTEPELEGVAVPVAEGLNAKVLPFAVDGLSDFNEYQFYAIANIEKDASGIYTISLYEKDSFEAGEPFFVDVPRNEVVEGEDPIESEILAYVPTDLTTTAGSSNGLVGVFANTTLLAGMGVVGADGEWTASAEGATIGGQAGYIDVSKFTGAVDGVEIVKTIVIEGLNDYTGVGSIDAENGVKVVKGIFTVDGKAVSAPQKGLIYIINGKKVRF